MKRKILSKLLVLCMTAALIIGATLPVISAVQTVYAADIVTEFPDVADSSRPYYKPVYWAVGEGIAKGYKNGNFGPADSCTRAQFVTFIWRMAGKPQSNAVVKFPDVNENMSAYKAIQWAVEQGIIVGYKSGKFGPYDTVLRRQVATMLWRWAGRPSVNNSANPFSDMNESDSSFKPVLWGCELRNDKRQQKPRRQSCF